MLKAVVTAVGIVGLCVVAASAQDLATKSTRSGGGGPIVTVSTSRPMTSAEMEAATRSIASRNGYPSVTVMYEQPAPPDKAHFMDFAWCGKAQLYPSGPPPRTRLT
jgi:hypothetical protein